jgi:hypothetical protein
MRHNHRPESNYDFTGQIHEFQVRYEIRNPKSVDTRELEVFASLGRDTTAFEEAQAPPLFKTTISHLKEEMKVWVKVGTSAAAKVVIDSDAPDIDDLKAAVKMTLVNKFLTTDKDDIVIRDPISKEEISSTNLLNLIDATTPGSVYNPFIVDAPQGI